MGVIHRLNIFGLVSGLLAMWLRWKSSIGFTSLFRNFTVSSRWNVIYPSIWCEIVCYMFFCRFLLTAEQCLFYVERFEQLRFRELGSLSSVSVEDFRVDYICFYLSLLLSDLAFRHCSPVGVSRCW